MAKASSRVMPRAIMLVLAGTYPPTSGNLFRHLVSYGAGESLA